MRLKLLLTFVLGIMAARSSAQTEQLPLPHSVPHVEVIDGKKNPANLPHWGEKNLLIFYVDPDVYRQNHEFTVEMEENKLAAGENIYGFGIVNLHDTWMPGGLIRKIATARTKKNGATILFDTDCFVRDAWNLGDINNKFVLMIVSKEGELVYMYKGELSKEDQREFYRVVDLYR